VDGEQTQQHSRVGKEREENVKYKKAWSFHSTKESASGKNGGAEAKTFFYHYLSKLYISFSL